MIAYLEGSILAMDDERLILLAGQVGYEVMLPVSVRAELATKTAGDSVSLYIYYHQTERQPKPVLIGFRDEVDKAFFQLFITVEAIGPMKAVKALTRPVAEVAAAIENKDVGMLATLSGIGKRTAQKIVATLEGKVDRFMALPGQALAPIALPDAQHQLVQTVLVEQLGHRPAEARQLIADALMRQPGIITAEQLFDAIYRKKTSE
ncbi:MAG: Holliday junction branch migration protein RuvA [Pseudomonadota bacterium]